MGKLRFNTFYIYYFGLIVLVAGLPNSVFLMSISQFIMLGAWLLSGESMERLRTLAREKGPLYYRILWPWFIFSSIANKFRLFFRDRTAVMVSSVFLLHLIGLLYTTDMNEGLKDVRIKIPLLLLPLLVSTMPKLDALHLRWLLYCFCASVFICTLIGTARLMGIGIAPITDTRQISAFISHIRFSLMICMSIFILLYYAWQDRSLKRNLLYFLLCAWFLVFLVLLESLTGIVILAVVGGLWTTYFIFTRAVRWIKFAYVIGAILLVFTAYYLVRHEVNAFYELHETADLKHLEKQSPHGHPYVHDLVNNNMQNGYYTGIYQCWEEMEPAWNSRSKINFMGEDLKGNQVRWTLTRYLTSKGLRKDQDGVNALSEEDVHYIEMGYPDYRYPHLPTLRTRIDGIIWEFNEYFKGKNPSGHSVTQRLEFWRAASGIIRKNALIGVGTGDQPDAFKEEYAINGTQLTEKYRLRSHNQFLAITVAFGFIGALWFVIAFFYPISIRANRRDFLYLTFFLVAFISFLNEDTLESQAGVTFFTFFNSLFLFGRKEDSTA